MVKDRDKIKRKPVAFDTTIPLQKKLVDIADSKSNYSEYIRTLMVADMILDGALEDLSLVKQLLNKDLDLGAIEKIIIQNGIKIKYDKKDFEIEL